MAGLSRPVAHGHREQIVILRTGEVFYIVEIIEHSRFTSLPRKISI